jgi:UDP-N-acetylglucosamine:LPS N-acetylglucosamine transferase
MSQTSAHPSARGPRVLIVGSTMGAGHMTAARVLAQHLDRRGADTRVVDYLALPHGPQGRLERTTYRLMVTRAPWLYDAFMRGWTHYPRLFRRVAAIGSGAFARGLAAEISGFHPDVVVSTYNLAGQLLGRMRRCRALSVPVATYVTDAGAHPYWVADGADLHLAPLPATAAALRAIGASHVEVVDPLVDAPEPTDRRELRRRLGLPTDELVVVVNGGSWGVGDIVDAARCAASAGAQVYVLCGNSARLAASVAQLHDCHAVGWTDAVAHWVKAADVVVDSAGGTTCWEALVAGTPVVVHRPIAGHGRLNAAALEAAGLAAVSRTGTDLVAAVHQARQLRCGDIVHGVDAADAVLAAA